MRNLILVLYICLGVTACKKDNSNTNYPYYFTATINGVNIKYEANDEDSRYGCGISQPSSANVPDDYDIYEGTLIEDMMTSSSNQIYVHILKYFTDDPTLNERVAMIHLGAYGYGKSDVSSATVNGASITYIDKDGKTWSSEAGDQTGSTFTITELIDNPESINGKIFKANFSCKLYDGNAGSIQVINATIRGKILGL